MRNSRSNTWLTKIVWVAGLVLIIFGRNYLNQHVLWRLSSSADGFLITTWLNFLIPFLVGAYLSLLLLWSGVRMNDPALLWIVAIPTTIIAVLPPLLQIFPLQLPTSLTWVVGMLNTGQLLPLVAGAAIVLSLGQKKKRR